MEESSRASHFVRDQLYRFFFQKIVSHFCETAGEVQPGRPELSYYFWKKTQDDPTHCTRAVRVCLIWASLIFWNKERFIQV